MASFRSALTAGLLFLSVGCTPIFGKPSGTGLIFSSVQFNERTTDHPVAPKSGESCASSVLGLVAWGDASAATAANTSLHAAPSVS